MALFQGLSFALRVRRLAEIGIGAILIVVKRPSPASRATDHRPATSSASSSGCNQGQMSGPCPGIGGITSCRWRAKGPMLFPTATEAEGANPWSTAAYIAAGCADVGSLIAFKRVV